MRWLLVTVLALLLSGAATAAEPEGFREGLRLSQRATVIAGKPATVYCARTSTAWIELLEARGHPGRVTGLTVSKREIYLPPGACLTLEGHLRGRRVGWFNLGVDTHTLVHEALHVRGLSDERETECAAIRELPRWLRSQFGIRKPKTLRLVMKGARWSHGIVMFGQPPCA